jgi:hypothetical protein
MKPCPREAETQAVLRHGHWPDACEPELRQHVATCDRCSSRLIVLETFQAARTESMQIAHLGHPGLLWWRAQLRRRNEALERVSKPAMTGQIFALCISILTAVALLGPQIGSQIRKGVDWSSWLPGWFPAPSSPSDALSLFASAGSDRGLILLLTGFGTAILLGAVVVYLAADRN